MGIEALKRQGVAVFEPMFLMVNETAGRLPTGTVELATNESAEEVARYPVLLIMTVRSGRPDATMGAGAGTIGYVFVAGGPGTTGTTGAGLMTGGETTGVVEAAGAVEVAGVLGTFEDTGVGTTSSVAGAGEKNEPR